MLLDKFEVRITEKDIRVNAIRVNFESDLCALLYISISDPQDSYHISWRMFDNEVCLYLGTDPRRTKDATCIDFVFLPEVREGLNFGAEKCMHYGVSVELYKTPISISKRRNLKVERR